MLTTLTQSLLLVVMIDLNAIIFTLYFQLHLFEFAFDDPFLIFFKFLKVDLCVL